jgi:hypothetical protein
MFLNKKTEFAAISEQEWIIASTIKRGRRRQLLHGPPFEVIIERIKNNMTFLTIKREVFNDCPNTYRFEIVIKLKPKIVDLFHNSASGYRAQYFNSVENGEKANLYAIKTIFDKLMNLISKNPKRTCPKEVVREALANRHAKIWIHQGKWLILRRKSERNLTPKRWLNEIPKNDKDKKRKLWAKLTPNDETRLKLKSALVKEDGTLLDWNHKPNRGNDIHNFGYS